MFILLTLGMDRSIVKENKIPVLILDDRRNWVNLLAELLEDEYEVTKCLTYGEVRHAIKHKSYHVAILDLDLAPSGSPQNEMGFEVAKELSIVQPLTQIIMVTGIRSDRLVQKAYRDLKVFHYLDKQNQEGFDFDLYRDVVQKAANEYTLLNDCNYKGCKVFISYSKDDDKVANILKKRLSEKEIDVWMDTELRAGEYFDEKIKEAIDAADVVMVLWCNSSLKSQWVKAEAKLGNDQQKLIPVLIEKVNPPFYYSAVHHERILAWDGDVEHEGFKLLLEAIRKKVK